MKNLLFLILFLLVFFPACQKGTIKQSGYCYNNNELIINNQLNLKGYYTQIEIIKRNIGYPPNLKTVEDNVVLNRVFYKDGIYLSNLEKEKFKIRKDRIKNKSNSGYSYSYWGLYNIYNDTIKAIVFPPPGTQGIGISYQWFKIIDQITIKEIYSKSREPITSEDIIKFQEYLPSWLISRSKGNFVYYDSLPNPDFSWIKKRKWFWCEKEQYKDWKRKMRIKKTSQ
jgi:hypothetical protein